MSISAASSSSSARRSRAAPAGTGDPLRARVPGRGRGLRRAGPVRLAEHRVEGDDVGLDRRRDDVRARGLAAVLARAALAGDERRGDPHRHGADRVGPLAERVDVVGEQPRVAVEDLGERLVDRAVERVDGAVAVGRGPPVVVAGLDDDGAAAADVATRT